MWKKRGARAGSQPRDLMGQSIPEQLLLDMFNGAVDTDVIKLILSESDNNVDVALEKLLLLSPDTTANNVTRIEKESSDIKDVTIATRSQSGSYRSGFSDIAKMITPDRADNSDRPINSSDRKNYRPSNNNYSQKALLESAPAEQIKCRKAKTMNDMNKISSSADKPSIEASSDIHLSDSVQWLKNLSLDSKSQTETSRLSKNSEYKELGESVNVINTLNDDSSSGEVGSMTNQASVVTAESRREHSSISTNVPPRVQRSSGKYVITSTEPIITSPASRDSVITTPASTNTSLVDHRLTAHASVFVPNSAPNFVSQSVPYSFITPKFPVKDSVPSQTWYSQSQVHGFMNRSVSQSIHRPSINPPRSTQLSSSQAASKSANDAKFWSGTPRFTPGEDWRQKGNGNQTSLRNKGNNGAVNVSLKLIGDCVKRGEWLMIIMRGCPGSGKSTLARKLVGRQGAIFSTDDYFMSRFDYKFDPSQLDVAHDWNRKRARQAMNKGVNPVIIDNTNIQIWEMYSYVEMSLQLGYKLELLEPETWWRYKPGECARLSIHGVAKDIIKRMLDRFEPISSESLLDLVERKSGNKKPPRGRKRNQRQSGQE